MIMRLLVYPLRYYGCRRMISVLHTGARDDKPTPRASLFNKNLWKKHGQTKVDIHKTLSKRMTSTACTSFWGREVRHLSQAQKTCDRSAPWDPHQGRKKKIPTKNKTSFANRRREVKCFFFFVCSCSTTSLSVFVGGWANQDILSAPHIGWSHTSAVHLHVQLGHQTCQSHGILSPLLLPTTNES